MKLWLAEGCVVLHVSISRPVGALHETRDRVLGKLPARLGLQLLDIQDDQLVLILHLLCQRVEKVVTPPRFKDVAS